MMSDVSVAIEWTTLIINGENKASDEKTRANEWKRRLLLYNTYKQKNMLAVFSFVLSPFFGLVSFFFTSEE